MTPDTTRRVMPRGGDVARRRLTFGVTTMLRKTPLMGLRSEWIDLSDPWLDVPKEWMKVKRCQKRPLSVPMCGWAVEQLPQRMLRSGFIWPNVRSGEPTENVTRSLQKLAEAAKVPEFSLHDLRATGNTWLANEGVDERIRQYLMGHADGGPVISRYTKITADTEKRLRDAVAIFDEIRSKHGGNVRSFFAGKRSARDRETVCARPRYRCATSNQVVQHLAGFIDPKSLAILRAHEHERAGRGLRR